ncbi:MAG: TIGR04283 family arsenosugar biosynthesis glycosyltransferase, partial [Pseudomonadota bacterium]
MISLIIPTLNEEHNIKNVLTYVLNLSGAYEVIVVDGGSQDNTVSIVEEEPRVRLIKSSKGRAIQMNIGAKYAKGTFLLFLHADTYLPENALSKINSFESDFEIAAGGFKHQFSSNDWRLKFISFLHNYRCKKSRLFYGDQALFVRRSLFNELGGYPNQTILEDWSFGQTLRNA